MRHANFNVLFLSPSSEAAERRRGVREAQGGAAHPGGQREEKGAGEAEETEEEKRHRQTTGREVRGRRRFPNKTFCFKINALDEGGCTPENRRAPWT